MSRSTVPSTRRWLRQNARRQWRALVPAMLGGLVRQLGFLAVPWILQQAIDDGLRTGDLTAVLRWSVALLLAGLVQFGGITLWEYASNLADARAGAGLRTALLSRRLTVTNGESGGAGDLVLRGSRDVDAVRVWVHGLPTWVVIGTTVAVLVPGLVGLDPWLLAVAGATVPPLVLLNRHYTRAYERASANLAVAHGERADAMDHLLRSGLTARGIGAEGVVRDRHHGRSAELTNRSIRAGTLLARWSSLAEGVPAIAVAVGVAVGAFAVLDGRLSVGGLVAFAGWMGTVGIAVQVGLIRLSQSVTARVAAERLMDSLGVAEEQTTDLRPAMGTTPPRGPGQDGEPLVAAAVELFPGGPTVDLVARSGELVAVTGATGSGKSALLAALAGTRAPLAGRVTLGGVPTDQLAADGSILLVPQHPLVLSGTVRENLDLGAGLPTERLRTALRDTGLLSGQGAEETYELGGGLDHHLLDGTASLSGGQQQRLALARALAAEPRVLLADDVTSAADTAIEAVILAALRETARDHIVIVATHRPAVVAVADRVIRL